MIQYIDKNASAIVESVITDKVLSHENKIIIETIVNVSNVIAVEERDFRTLISDLLDNEIDNCTKKCKDNTQHIKILINVFKCNLYINVNNLGEGKGVRFRCYRMLLSGRALVKSAIIKKYDGFICRYIKGNSLVVDILIPFPKL